MTSPRKGLRSSREKSARELRESRKSRKSRESRKAGWLPLALCLAVSILPACTDRDTSEPAPAAKASEVAPDFELLRLGGGRISLAQQRGKVVLVDFWATWCRPCIEEIPALNAVYARHRASGFEIVGVAVEDPLTPDQLERWTQARDVQYPIALGTLELAEKYGAFQFPFHVFVGPDGEILEQLAPGAHSEAELDAAIARHLGAL